MSKFTLGPDNLRNKGGRPPSARGIAARVLKMIGPDIGGICDQAVMLARTGDPAAISACASLLAAALQYNAIKSGSLELEFAAARANAVANYDQSGDR